MLVIPAIDLMNGKVVRLLRGDPKSARSYAHIGDPVDFARMWEAEGARMIHIVDLDAALGLGENINVIGEIIRSTKVQIQVGGGIRSVERAGQLINAGASRIVLGSLAFRSMESVRAILEMFGDERVVVALDHLNGRVMIDGWREPTKMMLREAAKTFSEMGVKFFLVTSIERDGMMAGPDIKSLSSILDLNINIIASGGVRSLDDIETLRDLGVYGVILGRALYEGSISLREALKAAKKQDYRACGE